MRVQQKEPFGTNGLVTLKNQEWLEKQRVAGKVAAGALSLLEEKVKEKSSLTLLELDQLSETYILDNKCQPTFKGYHGFPNTCCISVNKQLVHGIPTDYHLQEGDMVSFDLGATFEEVIADTAITRIYGDPKSEKHSFLIKSTEEALLKGIEAIEVGKRLGCIGHAIYKYARNLGLGVIVNYGGHGIDIQNGVGVPHAQPFVSNKANPEEGIRIQPGLVLAIEPMLTNGSTETWTDKDGWTVWCQAEISAHSEHTIFVHSDHVEIITKRK